jgi:hypothetical protein
MTDTDALIAAGFQAINNAIEQQSARFDDLEAHIERALDRVGRELAEEKKSVSGWPDLFVNYSNGKRA